MVGRQGKHPGAAQHSKNISKKEIVSSRRITGSVPYSMILKYIMVNPIIYTLN